MFKDQILEILHRQIQEEYFILSSGNITQIFDRIGLIERLIFGRTVDDADVFVAATGNDEANLLSCILVRKFDVDRIIARVSNPDHEEAFREVGIDEVISPEITAAKRLQQVVTNPLVEKLTTLGAGNAEIVEMSITNDKMVGKRFKEISPDKDYIIIARYENGKLNIPQPDNIVSRGEKITVLVKRGKLGKVTKKLEK